MFKKLFLFGVLAVLVGCGGSNQVIRTTKSSNSKTVVRKPSTTKTTSNTSNRTQTTKSGTINKNSASSTSEVLHATTAVRTTTQNVHDYIFNFREIAKGNMRDYGIPASIILAQGILESGAGFSPLSVQGNNHFGIKCHKEWTGASILHDDDEAQECFRKYGDPSESYRDHALFLTSRSRYSSLFTLEKDDYKGWAKGLRAAGYATDSKYPDKLIGIIERYQLYLYDQEVIKNRVIVNDLKTQAQRTGQIPAGFHEVIAGDTLYSISRKYNISVDEIKRINNLPSTSLSVGQLLKVK